MIYLLILPLLIKIKDAANKPIRKEPITIIRKLAKKSL